jgi:tetratricopeptide (TPR) repeat protein
MANRSLTEEFDYWNQFIRANPNDPNGYVRRGMVQFKLAKIPESIQDFDKAEQLDPRIQPYLWQRGLSYYYAQRFEEGARQFEMDLTVNAQDVEETVWRYLCIAQSSSVSEAYRTLLPVKNDPRPLMRWIYELFSGKTSPEVVLSMGDKQGIRGKFYAHLYVGLYSEAANQPERAKAHMTKAVSEYQLEDYMWHLARVHQQLRDWTT